jgi:hypothetical protein
MTSSQAMPTISDDKAQVSTFAELERMEKPTWTELIDTLKDYVYSGASIL